MPRTKIKLCGLSRREDIEVVNRLVPDYVGFVFAKKSKRYIDRYHARKLVNLLNKNITTVGVFQNQPVEEIEKIAKYSGISVVQLHGDEDEEYIEKIKSKLNLNIIKAFSVSSSEDIEKANKSNADLVLLDSLRAGSGTSFDHSLLCGMKRDYLLAGGLDATSVKEIVKKYAPFGVDVSSGIETNGKKDGAKMIAFVNNVRNGY